MIPRLCALRFLCERCRADNDDGQRARDNIRSKAFKGQDIGPRFSCPHGRGEVGAFVPWPPDPEPKGLGDSMAKAFRPIAVITGLEGCGLCAKTQEKFNAAFPYEIEPPA